MSILSKDTLEDFEGRLQVFTVCTASLGVMTAVVLAKLITGLLHA